jgi:glutathione S-transferase
MLKLISATPSVSDCWLFFTVFLRLYYSSRGTVLTDSIIFDKKKPYARKVRIVLAEKEIPFELITEVPWDSTTSTPQYNPLERLPVLILEDGSSVYESHYILETKFPDKTSMLPQDIDERLFVKKVEVVADGMCDALVLLFFEKQRAEGAQSPEWKARQVRKVDGGVKALSEWVGDKDFIVCGSFGLADVAAGSACGYIDVRFSEYPWRSRYPNLARYMDKLGEKQSFKGTVPVGQKIKDKIV